jgi:hypothetical protein
MLLGNAWHEAIAPPDARRHHSMGSKRAKE